MSWGATIFSGFVGALMGGAGLFGLANLWVKWYRISSFEGKAGFFVIGMGLLGFMAGALVAIIAARIGHASLTSAEGTPRWYVQLGIGVGAVVVALLVTLLISFLGADREEDLGGRGIAIAFEVRLPRADADGGPIDPASWPDEKLRLQLVSVVKRDPRGSAEAVFERAQFHEDQGQWILPARVGLFTSKGELCVNLTLGERRNDGFWPPISARSPHVTPEWSAWMRTMDTRHAASDVEAVTYRFRCVQE